MLNKAKADIRTEQENAMKAMESRVAEIALDAASKIMGEKNHHRILRTGSPGNKHLIKKELYITLLLT